MGFIEEMMGELDVEKAKSTIAAIKAKAAIGKAICDAVEGLTQEDVADVFSSVGEMLKTHAAVAAFGNARLYEISLKAMREANREINEELEGAE